MKPLNKKRYDPPTVTRVRLVVKDAILANCNSSPDLTPKNELGACSALTGCFYPPT